MPGTEPGLAVITVKESRKICFLCEVISRMELEYSELDGGIRLIRLTGKLDMEGTTSIQKQFSQHCIGENVFVLVDLSRMTYLSSIGIPMLVGAAKMVASNNGRLAFLNPQPNVRSILDITGVSHVIRIYNELETAQERLQSD